MIILIPRSYFVGENGNFPTKEFNCLFGEGFNCVVRNDEFLDWSREFLLSLGIGAQWYSYTKEGGNFGQG